ncbi:MAG: S53 family peptidase [Terriglobia bacterium]|jgi:subtilase family serine protease
MKARGPLFSLVLASLLVFSALSASLAQELGARKLSNHTPRFIATAKDLGPEAPSKQVTLRVWLQIHNTESLKQLTEQLYDPASKNYHSWLTHEQFNVQFAPTEQEVATVQKFLTENSLRVGAVGERNLYVSAQGSIADIQKAFHVQIHKYDLRGRTYRSNTADPAIVGPAGALVSWVGGLSDYSLEPHNMRPVNPSTGEPLPPVEVSLGPNGFFWSANCFRPPQLVNFSNEGALPKAVYYGNRYGADITNTALGSLAPCGYQPSEIQTAYTLNKLYGAGLDGAGQTIVIVDGYGSPTIQTDASFFSSFYGLPPLNLTMYAPLGPPASPSLNAATETTLDVEWAHSVAPGANIALVVAPTLGSDDLITSILYAVENDLGTVISNSYGAPESEWPGALLAAADEVLMLAAARGVSVNFSSGDSGDFSSVLGHTDVSYPASSPYATAIGGTSLALNADNTLKFQTGWGNNLTAISGLQNPDGTNTPLVPPLQLGFIGGAGGGTSSVYARPAFQHSVPAAWRMVPDVSYLADPSTGVEFLCTGSSCFGIDSSDLYVATVGGTSLACPMFSGMWAIAEQNAGGALGQAARLLYGLPYGAVDDIVPVVISAGSFPGASGVIYTSAGTIVETAPALAEPLQSYSSYPFFYSTLFNSNDSAWYVLTFGTDSSLQTKLGWDDVTGVGTPNGPQFVQAVAQSR